MSRWLSCLIKRHWVFQWTFKFLPKQGQNCSRTSNLSRENHLKSRSENSTLPWEKIHCSCEVTRTFQISAKSRCAVPWHLCREARNNKFAKPRNCCLLNVGGSSAGRMKKTWTLILFSWAWHDWELSGWRNRLIMFVWCLVFTAPLYAYLCFQANNFNTPVIFYGNLPIKDSGIPGNFYCPNPNPSVQNLGPDPWRSYCWDHSIIR